MNPIRWMKIHLAGVIGALLIIDGVGSFFLPGNNHAELYQIERVIRAIAGVILIWYDIYWIGKVDWYRSLLGIDRYNDLN